jgi:hypothetical protein
VDQTLENATPEDIGENLPETAPRYVAYRFGLELDPALTQPTNALIYFNPLDTRPDLKRTYHVTFENIQTRFGHALRYFQLNDLVNFTSVHFKVKILGLQGEASELKPVIKTYGREVV